MAVYTYPHRTGIATNKETIVAAGTFSTPVTGTALNIVSQVIPAHSIGVNGYLILDVFMTRTGTESNILVLIFLNGLGFYTDTMVATDTSLQTRFILYADHSTDAVKLESAQSTHHTPYYKGSFASQISLDINTEVDNDLDIGAVVFGASDSFTLEGYCIRTFNPDNSIAIVKGLD